MLDLWEQIVVKVMDKAIYALPLYVCICVLGCTGNTYGPDCASDCNCLNGADCSPVTGVCNCTVGYTGVSCESGENAA